jgi:hypothetical protein
MQIYTEVKKKHQGDFISASVSTAMAQSES